MPRLWNDTIEGHRRAVHEAILDTTAALVHEYGLTAVTMSQIAQAAGIGRATLYKYFHDVASIMVAWHHRHVTRHLEHLATVSAHPGEPGARLRAVLLAYGRIRQERGHHELAAMLHHGDRLDDATRQLHQLVTDLVAEAATAGEVRGDVPPGELAAYCLHALTAAATAASADAVDRLVGVIVAGMAAGREGAPRG